MNELSVTEAGGAEAQGMVLGAERLGRHPAAAPTHLSTPRPPRDMGQ